MPLTQEQLAWILVIIIIIQGVWLAGLTYLMWKRVKEKEKMPEKEEEKKEFT